MMKKVIQIEIDIQRVIDRWGVDGLSVVEEVVELASKAVRQKVLEELEDVQTERLDRSIHTN